MRIIFDCHTWKGHVVSHGRNIKILKFRAPSITISLNEGMILHLKPTINI